MSEAVDYYVAVSRTTRRRTKDMKARTDEDVWHRPYLTRILTKLQGQPEETAKLDENATDPIVYALFLRSDLSAADFYKQLAWEIRAGHLAQNGRSIEVST